MQKPKLVHRFSTQILLHMLLISIVAVTLLGLFYYSQTSDRSLSDIRVGLERMIDNGQSTFNQAIQETEFVFVDLQRDKELYNFFLTYDDTQVSPWRAQQDVSRIINNYVLHKDPILSVQIMTEKGIFYNTNTSFTSVYNMTKARLYQQAMQSSVATWIPTYDFTQEYGHTLLQQQSIPLANRYVCSLVGRLNAYDLSSGSLKMWPADVERPVMVINLSESYLRGVLDRCRFRPDAVVMILDEAGNVLSDADGDRLLSTLDGDFVAAIADSVNANHSVTSTVGGDRMLVSGAVLSNGWRIATAISEDEVRAEILQYVARSVGVITAVTLLISLLMSLLFSRRITRPITELREAIQQSGRGNFALRMTASTDEFNTVYEAFNDMNGQINQLIEDNYASRIREKEHQLQALRYQTSPHFLYNALTVIHMSAKRCNAAETARLTMHLSKMLNYTARDNRDTVTLREELDNVRDFMVLVDVGYEGTIQLRVDVPDHLLNVRLPKLCLQPLAENAVLHGLHGCTEGVIRIDGAIADGCALIMITDNGVGLPDGFEMREKEDITSMSIGLMNVHRRLLLLYGEKACLSAERAEHGGTRITVRVPL